MDLEALICRAGSLETSEPRVRGERKIIFNFTSFHASVNHIIHRASEQGGTAAPAQHTGNDRNRTTPRLRVQQFQGRVRDIGSRGHGRRICGDGSVPRRGWKLHSERIDRDDSAGT